MRPLESLDETPLQQLLGCTVLDQDGNQIGTVRSLWSHPETGKVKFFAVETGGLFWRDHVVPTQDVKWEETARVMQLPYTEAFIKTAPTISPDAEISETDEDNIHRFYGTERSASVGSDGWRWSSEPNGRGTNVMPEEITPIYP
ncbi:MAG: PRC-barrel domain-containing protein [Rhodospirillales bacterium]|nr:PRC-barrel domain-containing protein [Acetobacter sp.]